MKKTLTILLCVIVYGLSASAQKVHYTDSAILTIDSFMQSYYVECRDTIPPYYRPFSFTLRKYNNKKGDTQIIYNHIEFLRRRAAKEMDYWAKKNEAIIYEYWVGVYNALTMVMYYPYTEKDILIYKFRTK